MVGVLEKGRARPAEAILRARNTVIGRDWDHMERNWAKTCLITYGVLCLKDADQLAGSDSMRFQETEGSAWDADCDV